MSRLQLWATITVPAPSKVRSSLQSCNRSLVAVALQYAVELTQKPSRIAAKAEVKHY